MVTAGQQHQDCVGRNSRLGLWLFAVYVALYGGFIYLATFKPQVLAADAPGGVNWAIAYGLGLIFAAFVLALIYMSMCTDAAATTASEDAD